MPASMMLSGVAKSGSPISRWTMCLPSASSCLALASTTNAPSVPSRDMRSANLIVMRATLGLVDAEEGAAVDAQRLARDVGRLLRAEESASGRELGRVAEAAHRGGRSLSLQVLLDITARGGGDRTDAVGQDHVRRQAVDGDP